MTNEQREILLEIIRLTALRASGKKERELSYEEKPFTKLGIIERKYFIQDLQELKRKGYIEGKVYGINDALNTLKDFKITKLGINAVTSTQ